MKKIILPIGDREEEIYLPEDKFLYDICGAQASEEKDLAAATLKAIRNPIESLPLSDIVKPGDKVAIVVSDITRLVGTAEFLPVVLNELNAVGVGDKDIAVVIAAGTHRAHTKEEDILVCGEEVVSRVKIHQHNCRNNEELVELGTTSFGTTVSVNKYVAEADKVILTGAVTLHPMAGFGGGRKALLPGVAGYDTIMHAHSMNLAENVGDGCNPNCDAGILEGNPMHENITEACALLEPDFLINTVFTPDGRVHEVVAGHWYKAWKKGCDDLMAMAGVPIKEKADVVFASAGGSPKDINLYQSTKTHMNAAFAIKENGILIVTLDCPDIREPEIFSEWFSRSDTLQMEKDIRADFSMPAFVALKARGIVNKLTVYFVTRKENFDFVRRTGQIPVATLAEAWELAQRKLVEQGKKDYKITIMSYAPATLPILEK